jgi:hypothetical protein
MLISFTFQPTIARPSLIHVCLSLVLPPNPHPPTAAICRHERPSFSAKDDLNATTEKRLFR